MKGGGGTEQVAVQLLLSSHHQISVHSTVFPPTSTMAERPLSGLLSLFQSDLRKSLAGLPSSVGEVISSSLGLHTGPAQARQGGFGGGCNDAYSAFAFLSFLFALLTFIQNNGGRRRRRRAAESQVSSSYSFSLVLLYFSVFLLETWRTRGRRQVCWPQLWCTEHSSTLSTLNTSKTARNIPSVRRGKKSVD